MKEFTICISIKNYETTLNCLFRKYGTEMRSENSFTVCDGNLKYLEADCNALGLHHGSNKDWCYTEEL